MIASFAHQGVNLSLAIVNYTLLNQRRFTTHKIGSSKSSGDKNGYTSTIRSLNADISAHMRKDFFVAHSLQCQFTPVTVSGNYHRKLVQ